MPVDVIFPKVSLDQDEGSVARWCVIEGQSVTEGEVLFEIDNDKAAVEVVASATGVIRGLRASGDVVATGTTVARIFAGGESASVPVAAAIPVKLAAAPIGTTLSAAAIDAGGNRRPPNPTPLARRLAREQGIRLDGLVGTGPGGRVQKQDVVAVMGAVQAPAATTSRRASATDLLHSAWLRNGDGTPVVMLHGFSGDLNTWRGLWAGGRSHWPALGVDLPGHGQSPRDIPADLDLLAEGVEKTLASLGIGPVVLAGHSLGAVVATRIARRGFVDARGLCLFAPAGLGPEIHAPFVEGILRAQSAESLRPWLELLVHDRSVISDTFVRQVEAQRRDQDLTQAMRRFAECFFPDGTQRFSIVPDLASVGCPVRVVFGRQDRILPFPATQRLPENVGLHACDDCGHMPQIEKPALALRILDEVWRSASS